ncbi:MAG TPA: DegT/DnrJ/EryC1/StrS family aminotransferase [Victivallales bacterium]|nr:DegT/DnrJ/EryC1/StrS family aminotransferase [Victivallales bacterium]
MKDDGMKLAINGGKPVRTKPLPRHCVGANLIGKEEKELVCKVIDTQCLFRHNLGKCLYMVEQFEDELKKLIGTKYVLATSSGSAALFCAIKALNIGKGDEVIIPSFGWVSDYNAVELSGAKPVLADVDDSMNLNPEDFKRKITKRTKAVIVIYYQGAASRVDEIVKIARKHGIKVIEDVAQAIGGSYENKKLGNWGDVAIFSLQHNKIITTGDGGAFATNDQEFYERAVRYHDLGNIRPRFKDKLEKDIITKPFPGCQFRMNELTGAVALAQIRKLPQMLKTVKKYSDKVREALKKEFPDIKLRDVKPQNDLGIVIEIDLGNEERKNMFRKAYQAEGLMYGATSGCGTLTIFEAVVESLKERGEFREKDFAKSKEIEGKMAGIAVLPVHTEKDINDIIKGAVKVLGGLGLLERKGSKRKN